MAEEKKKDEELEARAYRLLGQRAYTVRGLSRTLSRHASPGRVRRVVAKLVENGSLDDEQYARDYVAQRLSGRPSGVRYLEAALLRKGVAPEIVEKVTAEIEPDDQLEAALEAARKKARLFSSGIPVPERRRKLYRFLIGRGFAPETAAEASRVAQETEEKA